MSKKKGTPAFKITDLKLENSITGDKAEVYDLRDRMSTGIELLDAAIGGGWYSGRVYEIAGQKSSGKSTFLLQTQKEFQKQGGVVAHVETEATLDIDRAKTFGLELERIVMPENQQFVVEPAFKWLKNTINTIRGKYSVSDLPIMGSWDTIGACVTEKQYDSMGGEKMDKSMDQGAILQLPRALKFLLQEFVPFFNKQRMPMIFVNQVYRNTDAGMYAKEHEKWTTPGGNGLHHACSVRLHFHRFGKILNAKQNLIGGEVRITPRKCKQGPELLMVEVPFFYDTGYAKELGALNFCLKHNILESKVGWVGVNVYGRDVKIRKSRLGTRGEGMVDTPFYWWMISAIYRWYASQYRSLEERYIAIADQIDAEWSAEVNAGVEVYREHPDEEIITTTPVGPPATKPKDEVPSVPKPEDAGDISVTITEQIKANN